MRADGGQRALEIAEGDVHRAQLVAHLLQNTAITVGLNGLPDIAVQHYITHRDHGETAGGRRDLRGRHLGPGSRDGGL